MDWKMVWSSQSMPSQSSPSRMASIAALVATGALAGSGLLTPSRARAQGASVPVPDVKALVFDTFGTVVDWRNGVARETEKLLKPLGYNFDWLAFAGAWRKEYAPSMEE